MKRPRRGPRQAPGRQAAGDGRRRRCDTVNFLGQRGVGARAAVDLAMRYAEGHPGLAAQRRATPIASLIATCAATMFNPEACTVPLTIPFRATIPSHQPQYALGRMETLLRAGYYNAGGCIRALNLDYGADGTSLRWDIRLNDFFVACTAARKHPFGTFPARLVLDVAAVAPGARARAGRRGHVVRENVVQRAAVAVPAHKAVIGPETVTAREMCQLAKVFGMRLYAPRDQAGPTRVAFFSHVAAVPRGFEADWVAFDA